VPPGLAGAGTVQQMSSQDSSSGSRAGTSMSMCAAAPLAASCCCRRRLADGGVDPCSEPSTCGDADEAHFDDVPGCHAPVRTDDTPREG